MSLHTTPSPLVEKKKLRTFSPVILFHDHHYVNAGSGDLQHVHIPYGDPSYGRHLDSHKKRIHEMLQTNGRYWLDIITWTRDHPEPLDHSPVPSLVSSPSPPHHHYQPSYSQHPLYYSPKHKNSLGRPPSPQDDNESDSNGFRLRPNKHMTDKKVTSASASSTNKRRRGNLPKAVTAILRDWLSRHKKHPYPTEEEKAALAAETNLNLNQISNWFINARRRILQPMLEQEEEQDKNEMDLIVPYDARHLDDVYHDRRLRKRSATDVLAVKYPPTKRMAPNTHNSVRRRS
ncbi:hypothetical protein V8B55DRAFT_1548851 [Mucor lusitanicus]|uniref:Homeobox domain-containing protein n=2 Tax=Mucor circinelloides f. lusitanicus TaxID=29924 RepID=A0A8H4B9D6_MUCCL|nr:hypothetical protein FB192DRAFT_1439458 [Mucor lusitanicus]